MDRERITISIKKKVLDKIDKYIDGTTIRNRSHAFETLSMKALGENQTKNAVVLLGGDDALKMIPSTKVFLEQIERAGFNKAIIAVGFLGDKVKEKLSENPTNDLSLEFFDKGQGSGGALYLLKNKLTSTFVVFNSLKPCNIDIDKLIAYHKEHNSIATVATRDFENMTGVYVFEPRIFDYISKGFSMIEDDIFPKLIEENKIIICPVAEN